MYRPYDERIGTAGVALLCLVFAGCVSPVQLHCSFSGETDNSEHSRSKQSSLSQAADDRVLQFIRTTADRIQELSNISIHYLVAIDDIPGQIGVARTLRGERQIVFDRETFSTVLENEEDAWALRAILAHEVAHLLYGHTVPGSITGPRREHDADEFSGAILYSLGADVHQAQAAVRRYHVKSERAVASHGALAQRLGAVRNGWRKARERDQLELRRNLYSATMRRIFDAWVRQDVRQAAALLHGLRPRPGEPDIRGFEWYHYWRLIHAADLEIPVGTGESSSPSAWQFSAGHLSSDGRYFFAACTSSFADRGDIFVWDMPGGRLSKVITRATSLASALSPDGKVLASAEAIRGTLPPMTTIRFIDVESERVTDVPELGRVGLPILAYSPDGETLAVAGWNKTLQIMELSSRRVTDVKAGKDWATSVTFSPDSRYVGIGNSVGSISIFDVRTKERLDTAVVGKTRVGSIAFSRDGAIVAAATAEGAAALFRWKDGKLRDRKDVPLTGTAVAFSKTEDVVAVASGKTVHVMTLRDDTLIEVAKLTSHLGIVNFVTFAPNGELLTGDTGANLEEIPEADAFLRLWRWKESRSLRRQDFAVGYDQWGLQLAVSSDGAHYAAATDAHGVEVRPLSSTKVLARARLKAPVRHLEFCANGQLIAAICQPKISEDEEQDETPSNGESTLPSLHVWEWTGDELMHRPLTDPLVTDFRAARGASRMVISSYGKLQLAEMISDSDTLTVEDIDLSTSGVGLGVFEPLEVSADGRWLLRTVYGETRGTTAVEIADLNNKEVAGRFTCPGGRSIDSLAITADGLTIAAGDDNGRVIVWDRTKSRSSSPIELLGHGGPVRFLAFHPDDETLVVLSEGDSLLRVWHAHRGTERGWLSIDGEVRGGTFSFDGRGRTLRMLTRRGNGIRLTIWDSADENEVHAYFTRCYRLHPRRANESIDFAISCWGYYLYHKGTEEGASALRAGLAAMKQLATSEKLSEEEQHFIEEFQYALDNPNAD